VLEELCGDFSSKAETRAQDFILHHLTLPDAVTLKLQVKGKGMLSIGVCD
jgi:hypothetical protein